MGVDDMGRNMERTFGGSTFPLDIYDNGGSCIRTGIFRGLCLTFDVQAGWSKYFVYTGALKCFMIPRAVDSRI